MNRTCWIGGLGVAGILLFEGIVSKRRPATEQSFAPSVAPRPEVQLESADPVPVVPTTVGTGVASEGSWSLTVSNHFVTEPLVSAKDGSNGKLLSIRGGEVLATVNGTPLQLKDLLPLPAEGEGSERLISIERYSFLLERAVDRELTFQNARAQGVELTATQHAQLATLRVRWEGFPADVFDDLQHNVSTAGFEARDATALLLQELLAEKAGVPSRDVTAAQVNEYFELHRGDYAILPTDSTERTTIWESIDQDIRLKLARQAQSSHDEEFLRYFDRLRAAAQTTRTQRN